MFVKASSHPATTGIRPHLSTRAYFPSSTANLFPLLQVSPMGSHVQESIMPCGGGAPGQVTPLGGPGQGTEMLKAGRSSSCQASPAVSVLLASNV